MADKSTRMWANIDKHAKISSWKVQFTNLMSLQSLLACLSKRYSAGIKKESWSHVGHRQIGVTMTTLSILSTLQEEKEEVMHPPKGTPEYEEWRRKQSESHKGQPAHNKGKFSTEETKAKMSAALKGRKVHNKGIPMPDEQKAKLLAANTGRKRPPEEKAKISASMKGKPKPWQKGRPAHNKGKPMSAEQRAKLSEVRKGGKHSPETRAKMSATRKAKGYTPSAEHRAKTSAVHKNKFVSEETRAKIGAAGKGRIPPIKGKKHSAETKAKMGAKSLARWEKMTDEQKTAKLTLLQDSVKDIKDSWIERYYAQQLDAQGIVYEQQKGIGWYRVDFYIPSQNKVIELQGCYWHDCEQCGHANKHKGKKESDTKRHEYLRKKGYLVEIIWEHDLPKKPV